ncbi:TerC family protein [Priestia filamentosa]|uniref:TerC family protein n=1 Tax=Priestia filamentosa TaxID=1402861 RepID=UPI00397CBBD8
MLELFGPEFWSALLAIILIDLVLAGDNAIVIGMAARKVPQHQQKKVIFWGTFGAIFIRAIATLLAVWLLKIPGLMLVGGLALMFIAYKLLVEEEGHQLESGNTFMSAIKTILIADALMGLDNVLAVAGASHGSFLLVVIGLIISIPIMVWGSSIIVKLIDRYPIIIKIGAGVIALTAAKMVTGEKFLKGYFEDNPLLKWGFVAVIVVGILILGEIKKRVNYKAEL